ncbi:hypothetical protein B0H11DRAFT_2216356 [Mycena galericulata]|nr:hypothetical protein B0H11DRAFT_2216356 [Mycena galericulata]
MSTYTVPRSASTGVYPNFPSPSPVAAEDEPDEEWKEKKRNEIENGFKDMIQEAKDRLEQNLQKVTPKDSREYDERKAFYVKEFQQETANLKSLAKEEFTHALGQERVMRRLTRGGQINGTVKVSVVEEQEAILAQIKRDNTRRRDSTLGPSPPPNISSAGPSSDRPAPTSQEFSQRQPEPLRVPRREATQPAPGPTSPPPSSDVPSSPQPPSPETSKPPPRPYHPGPIPSETRASAPQHPTSAPDPRLSSHGRTATAPAQERPTPTTGAPFPPTAPPSPEQHFPANASSSSHRAQTSPASAGGPRGGGPLRQTTGPPNPPPDRTSPGIGAHGRANFDSYSATTAPLRPKMSQTWNTATSPPIPIPIVAENHSRVAPLVPKRSQNSMHSTWNDATPPSSFPTQGAENHRISPLTAKRSQSNFHSSTGRRAESVWMGSGSEMTAEPEEEEEEPAYASEPAVPARPRDEGVEKETPLGKFLSITPR